MEEEDSIDLEDEEHDESERPIRRSLFKSKYPRIDPVYGCLIGSTTPYTDAGPFTQPTLDSVKRSGRIIVNQYDLVTLFKQNPKGFTFTPFFNLKSEKFKDLKIKPAKLAFKTKQELRDLAKDYSEIFGISVLTVFAKIDRLTERNYYLVQQKDYKLRQLKIIEDNYTIALQDATDLANKVIEVKDLGLSRANEAAATITKVNKVNSENLQLRRSYSAVQEQLEMTQESRSALRTKNDALKLKVNQLERQPRQ